MGATTLNAPIIGMSGTPTHHGYRIVAGDGGPEASGGWSTPQQGLRSSESPAGLLVSDNELLVAATCQFVASHYDSGRSFSGIESHGGPDSHNPEVPECDTFPIRDGPERPRAPCLQRPLGLP